MYYIFKSGGIQSMVTCDPVFKTTDQKEKHMKKILREIFIDGLGGMATGLFATLIIGTIIVQISTLIPGSIGSYIFLGGKLAMALTGACIGYSIRHDRCLRFQDRCCGQCR